MRSENGGDDLPIEVWEDGLSAKRICLASHRAIKDDKHESSAAYKNLILLIAFVVAMMQKIESQTWWWFDGMVKMESEPMILRY